MSTQITLKCKSLTLLRMTDLIFIRTSHDLQSEPHHLLVVFREQIVDILDANNAKATFFVSAYRLSLRYSLNLISINVQMEITVSLE